MRAFRFAATAGSVFRSWKNERDLLRVATKRGRNERTPCAQTCLLSGVTRALPPVGAVGVAVEAVGAGLLVFGEEVDAVHPFDVPVEAPDAGALAVALGQGVFVRVAAAIV